MNMEKGGVYRIMVEGDVDENWSDELGGMTITVHRKEDSAPFAILEGRLLDQAALSGVLEALYELHMPVLSVELLSN
jgi:hypothetical protein